MPVFPKGRVFMSDQRTDGCEGLSSSGFGIGKRKNLSRKIALIAYFFERRDHGNRVGVPEAHRLTVRVGEMDVADVLSRLADRSGEVTLLDVHVIEIRQQDDVSQLMFVEKAASVAEAIEKLVS